MAFDYRKFEYKRDSILRDPRDHFTKFLDKVRKPVTATTVFVLSAAAMLHPWLGYFADILLFYNSLYFIWLIFYSRKYQLPYKMPKTANRIDPHNKAPGSNKPRMADGILYIGNEEKTNEEIWFTNTDARTHILYLGTTGSGKTEGLKSMVTNALGWGSGFIYVDGKADTDLWGSISSLARRFGRDDDLLVLNYMTGNSDARIASNTINPFNQGSASYLTNLLVSLMPDVQGDNAMWKDRAVALIAALMPILTWQRTHQEKLLNINTIRESLVLKRVISLSRAPEIPERLRKGVMGYLDTLPGYKESAYADDGSQKPNPKEPPIDYGTVDQQHGYLAMQFTRQLQSLADDYGYIFETPSPDIDMMDVVLNRRIVVVLIPALEKSADETANLGKIVGSMLKGMMGATLGSSVEGDTEIALENKPTRSSTPFMAVFDEVGYYTTQGMAVMAAQARSLGFCLVFAGQDLPAMEKRVKEEARSIVANCNLKIFGKLEDPTQTKEFFEKTVGEATVIESSTRKQVKQMFGMKKFDDTENYNITTRAKASYDQLKSFKEGQSIISFGDRVVQAKMFYSNVGKIKSLRVSRFITVPHPDPNNKRSDKEVDAILERMRDKSWTAKSAIAKTETSPQLVELIALLQTSKKENRSLLEQACATVTRFGYMTGGLAAQAMAKTASIASAPKPAAIQNPVTAAALEHNEENAVSFPVATDIVPADAMMSEPMAQEPAPTASTRSEADYNKISSGSVRWDALVDDDQEAAAPLVSEQLKAPLTEKAINRGVNIDKAPTVEGSVNWKELLAEDGGNDPVTGGDTAVQETFDLGGFGSFGTGFGGIGGLGGVTFPSGRYGGLSTPSSTLPPAAPEQPPEAKTDADQKDGEPPADGGTINWKDLL